MPDTVNGYPVIAHFDLPGGRGTRNGRAILIDRGKDTWEHYVVTIQYCEHFSDDNGPWDTCWDHGDYCSTLAQAFKAFVSRIKRYRPEVKA